jgi:hypothetical protein
MRFKIALSFARSKADVTKGSVTELAVACRFAPLLLSIVPQSRLRIMMMNRRSRIISFRLSPEEYESLQSLSQSNGARSISEFTRSVACKTASNGEAAKIDSTLENIKNAIAALDRHVERLNKILEKKEEQ